LLFPNYVYVVTVSSLSSCPFPFSLTATHLLFNYRWNTLRGLNLESNPLTGGGNDSSGIKAFANMLASNNTLRTLNFFRTDLDDFGVR